MYTAWVYDAIDAAYQDTGDEGLANYYMNDDRSDIGYVQIFIRAAVSSINILRRYAEHAKPYNWNIKIDPRGDYYSVEFYIDDVADHVI